MAMEMRLLVREPLAAALALVLPAANYLLFGFVFPTPEGSDSYVNTYTPSATGLVILTVALFGLLPGLVGQRDSGVFRRLLVTPLDPRAILISTLSRNTLVIVVGTLQMIALGYFVFNREVPAHPAQLLLAVGLSAATLFSLAFLLGSAINRAGTAFGIAAILFQPMLFLSGAAMPVETLPDFAQAASEYVPMRHAVRILRAAWDGNLFGPDSRLSLLIMVTLLVACIAGCVRMFRWSTKES